MGLVSSGKKKSCPEYICRANDGLFFAEFLTLTIDLRKNKPKGMQSFRNVGNIYFKAILPYNSQTKLTNQSIDPEFHPKICIIRTPGRDSRSPAKVRPTDDEFQRGGINSVTTRKDLLFSL